MNAGERAMAAAAHAARWKAGSIFEDEPVKGVAVTNEWHVVLCTPRELVRLDPDDQIVSRRPRSRTAEAETVEPEPVSDPVPAAHGEQQELF